MDALAILVDLVEIVIIVLAVLIAAKQKKVYGWLLAISYALYVVPDVMHYANLGVSSSVSAAMMMLAVPVALVAFWLLYKEN